MFLITENKIHGLNVELPNLAKNVETNIGVLHKNDRLGCRLFSYLVTYKYEN